MLLQLCSSDPLLVRISPDRFHHDVDAVSLQAARLHYFLSGFLTFVPLDDTQDFEVSAIGTPVDDRAPGNAKTIRSLNLDLEGIWLGRVDYRYGPNIDLRNFREKWPRCLGHLRVAGSGLTSP